MPTTATTGRPEDQNQSTEPGPSVHALLRDGTTMVIRRPSGDDTPAVTTLFDGLSPESVRLRFFGMGWDQGRIAAQRICQSPSADGGALIAEVESELDGEAMREVIGEAEYWRLPDGEAAEIAFAVAEGYKGQGVATLLLEHLAAAARSAGVRRFTAETMFENRAMAGVFTAAGLRHTEHSVADGLVYFDIGLDSDDAYLDAVADREQQAAVASLIPLLRPGSIAVIDAGRKAGGVGRAVLDNILSAGFAGPLHAVNPHSDRIGDVPCAESVEALPETPDLAVIALPAARVAEAAIACGRRGVRALVVVTSGLDAATGRGLLAICRRYGMRMVGPNCLGIASLGGPDGLRVDATFAGRLPAAGVAGVGVQSGGVGVALLEHLSRLGIGISSFISLGDKYDVSGNDLLDWWSQDGTTRLAVLYLESIGNPRKFSRIARRVARTMPILTVTAGRSPAGTRAAASHTAAAATPSVTRDALYRQAGVIATRSIAELLDAAALLTAMPLPAGRRVAVVSNAGGAGVLAADACTEAGLSVPELSDALRTELAAVLGPVAVVANPIDAGAAATAATLRSVLEHLAAGDEVDAVLVLLAPTALTDLGPVLTTPGDRHGKPLVAVRIDQSATVQITTTADDAAGGVPTYADAENAVRALAHAADYSAWLGRPAGSVPTFPDIRASDAAAVVAEFLHDNPDGGWLPAVATTDLLGCYGIPHVSTVLAATEHEALVAATAVGGPVALKAWWPGLVHKSDVGGVVLDLEGMWAVRNGYQQLAARFGDQLAGVVVQPMAADGLELLAGVTSDEVFGPLVVFGLGGVTTDVLGEHVARLAPLTVTDAGELVRSAAFAPLLYGFRGRPPVDVAAVEAVLMRLSRLASDLPDVAEADLNPLMASPDGVLAVDARVRLVPRDAVDPYLRRLR